MSFLLRATFWLGLVLLYLPDPPPAAPRADALPQASGSAAAAAVEHAAGFCRDHAAACLAAAAALAETASRPAPRPAAPSVDTLTAADRLPPFGGPAVRPGSAPLTAPLPPRRPA